MGASGWSYFVPYEKNVKDAFTKLQNKVFEDKDYYDPYEMYNDDFSFEKEYALLLPNLTLAEIKSIKESIESYKTIRRTKVNSISELRERNAESGTHSILDIHDISDTDDLWEPGRIPDHDLLEIFTTLKPSHEMILANEGYLESYRGRWSCTFIVVYKNDQPDEYYFTGYSGD